MVKGTGRPPRLQPPKQLRDWLASPEERALREQLQRIPKLRFPSAEEEDQLEQLWQLEQSSAQPEQQPPPPSEQLAPQTEQQPTPQTEQPPTSQPEQSSVQLEQQPIPQPEQQSSVQPEEQSGSKTGRKKSLTPEETEQLRAAYDAACRADPKRKQSDVFNELRTLLGRTVSDTTLRTEIVARK